MCCSIFSSIVGYTTDDFLRRLKNGAVPIINPLLGRDAFELVIFDLRIPYDHARGYGPEFAGPGEVLRYLTTYELQQPACHPPREVLYVNAPNVYHPQHPLPGKCLIRVSHSELARHVTVRDVLRSIYKAFNTPPDPKAWSSVDEQDPALRQTIIGAHKKRCSKRAKTLNTTTDEQKVKGLMCVDWLGPKTNFGGLKLGKKLVNDGGRSNYELWDLIVREPLSDENNMGLL